MATRPTAQLLPRRRRALRLPRHLRRRVPRRWRAGLHQHPNARRQIGVRTAWAKTRQILFTWWVWAIVAITALVYDNWGWAIGTGLMAAFSFLVWPSEVPPRVGLEHEFSVDDDEFLTTIAGSTGIPFFEGNAIEILNNGDEFYPAMLKSIEQAQGSVTIEAYIYWAGDIGKRFAQALAARAKAGVGVKILLDAVGSSTIGDEILEILEQGGCQLAWYNPARPYSIGRLNHRTHRKSLIIDGRLAFTGGAGIADHWMGHAQDSDHWRDIQIRVEGPAVMPLQTGFAQNWLQTTGEVVTGFEFYPAVEEPAGALTVQTILSSPESGASTARTFYYLSIAAARRSVDIANPYFVPDQGAIDLLVGGKAARREGARHGRGHPQRQLDCQTEQRAAIRAIAEGRHRDLRVQPHDAPSEDDGGRWSLVNGGHDQLRQPFVRAQRREQRLRLRSSACETAGGDLRRRHHRLRGDDAEEVA